MTLCALALAIALAVVAGAPEATRVDAGELAADVAAVVEAEGAIPELGARGTARLLLAISWHESGWRSDVDSGAVRGQGIDVCVMQLRPVAGMLEAWTVDEVLADRRRCFTVGLRRARRSIAACRVVDGAKTRLEDRLAAYASGSCKVARGVSREFFALERRFRSFTPAAISSRTR